MFFSAAVGLLGAEASTSFRHISSRNIFDAELVASWQVRLRATGNYPFVSVGGGVRHEDVGSFGATRYPLGAGAGLRALLSSRVAVRAEYQYRRVLNDPVGDFNEHQVLLGLSVFFHNRPSH
jgi:opacity protein-like surface antigen